MIKDIKETQKQRDEREDREQREALDSYDDEFLKEERREFFESFQIAVQDCLNRRYRR